MIDIENDVFDKVSSYLLANYPDIEEEAITGEYVDIPASLPAVTIVEASNYVFERMRTVEIENAVRVMYEVNVYSNKVEGKKEEAKAIAAIIDEAFRQSGFTRTMRNQVANLNDSTIHRIVARYEATVGPAIEAGHYLVYQNY